VSVRVKAGLTVLVIAIVIAGVQAVAIPKGSADATGSDGHGKVRVGASSGSSRPNQPGTSDSDGGAAFPGSCIYAPAPPYVARALGVGGPLPGEWLLFGCPGFDLGLANSQGIIWMNVVWVTYARPLAVNLRAAEQAESSITLPSPVIETDPSGTAFVNLSTWFWVSRSVWHPVTAIATAGGVTSAATATPIRVEFSTGDGGSFTCSGPGTAYDRSEPSSAQTTACFHVYHSSSANQQSPDGNPNNAAYVVTATITWSVTWDAIGAPGGGTLPPVTTTSTARLRVEQIESVELP
jgi:hypothetical protein